MWGNFKKLIKEEKNEEPIKMEDLKVSNENIHEKEDVKEKVEEKGIFEKFTNLFEKKKEEEKKPKDEELIEIVIEDDKTITKKEEIKTEPKEFSFFERIKNKIYPIQEPPKELSYLEKIQQNLDNLVTLSYTQRLYGFLIFLALGLVFIILAIVCLSSNILSIFALFYTFGNLFCLISTFFLMGPFRQLKMMFTKERVNYY
jgi:hypothetical protein